jgi:hypothetical protein
VVWRDHNDESLVWLRTLLRQIEHPKRHSSTKLKPRPTDTI